MAIVALSRTLLGNALTWVTRAIPSRPANPALAGVKLELKNNSLTLSAFDYEQSAAAKLPVEGEDFEILVSGKLLAELVKACTADTVSLDTSSTSLLLIKSGKSSFSIPAMNLADHPTLPAVPPQFGSIAGHAFASAVHQCAIAAGNDIALPLLTSVMVKTNPVEKTLTIAATDRYRLASTVVPYAPEAEVDEELIFLVPNKLLDNYVRYFDGTDVVVLHYSGTEHGGLFGVSGEKEVATTRLIDGQFPNYETLVPTEFVAEVEIVASDLIGAVKRVGLVAADRSQPVKLLFSSNTLRVSVGETGTATIAQQGHEILDIHYEEEEDFIISFNQSYLLDGLSAVNSPTVRIKLVSPTKPALLTPNDPTDKYMYLLMPLRG